MMTVPELPALVSDDGATWWVWCTHCRRTHMHGADLSHRAAHCSRKGSPYERTGYTGVASGATTVAALRALTESLSSEAGRGKARGASSAEPQPAIPAAVYWAYDAAGVLLYVGVSRNFGTRWQQHMREKPWWPDVKRLTAEWFPDEESAYAAETGAIRAEKPRWNIAKATP